MTTELLLRCHCGSLRGSLRDVSPPSGNRLICYCDDCQAFAHYLGREQLILNPHGDTDIFQLSPSRVRFHEGQGQLSCVRLTSRGILRWYVSCCMTPIGNTLATYQAPFVGLIHSCIDVDATNREELLSPIRHQIQARFARPGLAQEIATDGAPFSLMLKLLAMLATARLRSEHKQSPFFDHESRQPVSSPQILDPDLLHTLRSKATSG